VNIKLHVTRNLKKSGTFFYEFKLQLRSRITWKVDNRYNRYNIFFCILFVVVILKRNESQNFGLHCFLWQVRVIITPRNRGLGDLYIRDPLLTRSPNIWLKFKNLLPLSLYSYSISNLFISFQNKQIIQKNKLIKLWM
jgi:hypothetical protein